MTSPPSGSSGTLRHRLRVVLQFGLGLGLLVLGVGNLTDTINWTLPPLVYLLAGIGLFVYGVGMLLRR